MAAKREALIMFPDFNGRADESFVLKLREDAPLAMIMAIPNGPKCEGHYRLNVDNVCPGGNAGLAAALQAGYQRAVDLRWEGPIVRLDTAEHDPKQIPRMLEHFKDPLVAMVIGDLRMQARHLIPGTPDELSRDVFPTLYGGVTNSMLPLSNAHGFQAFRDWRVLARLQPIVTELQLLVAKGNNDEVPTWGFDAMMALAAHHVGLVDQDFKVVIEMVDSIAKRDRPADKIAEQFRAALLICTAFHKFQHGQR